VLKRLIVLLRWLAVWTLPTALLSAAGILLWGGPWGACLGAAYPLWLVARLFLVGPALFDALPPRVCSGGRFAELLPSKFQLEVVREPSSWGMVTRIPLGSTYILLTEGLLQGRSTQEICEVLKDLEAQARDPQLSLRTLAASLEVGRSWQKWRSLGSAPDSRRETRLPLSTQDSKLSVWVLMLRLVRLSQVRFLESLMGAPILGGKDRLAIRY
jgi:hypothetical protein